MKEEIKASNVVVYMEYILFREINLKNDLLFKTEKNERLSLNQLLSNNILIENKADFLLHKEALEANINKLIKSFPVHEVSSIPFYEQAFLNSAFLSRYIKTIITMNNFSYSEFFDMVEPILPKENKQEVFFKMIEATILDDKLELRLLNLVLNNFLQYCFDEQIEVSVKITKLKASLQAN